MRIIAGQWRGHRIIPPPGEQTRPILDRAKTVLFDVLGDRLAAPGSLPPIAVLDLFSGTGTLGLEALSRGARYCRFYEQHRATAALLRENLALLKVGDEADVMPGDATAGGFPPPPVDDDGIARYELVFVDPPYRMLTGERPTPPIRNLLNTLVTSPAIAPSTVIVVRHDARKHNRPLLAPLVDLFERQVGQMMLRFCVRPDAPPAVSDEEER